MARVLAYSAFDLDDLDLHRLAGSAVNARLYDNEFAKLNGVSYPDVFQVIWDGGDASTAFGGTNITYDPRSLAITGGTATGILEAQNGDVAYAVQGIALSARALFRAAQTTSAADDDALIREALSGADTFVLSSGADRARGYDGDDVLNGRGGNDVLFGGAGCDRLDGGTGADVLTGGRGADVLTGGAGADDFVFNAAAESRLGALRDVIRDFARGQDDIVLGAIDANAARGGNQAFRLDAGGAFSAGEIRQTQSGANLLVEMNTDGDRAAEMSILLNNVTGPLAGSDFLF